MQPLKDTFLAGQTIKYGDIQFGGADAPFPGGGRLKMMPPEYSLAGDFVYDDADRACTHTRYLLNVLTVVFNETEPIQSAQMDLLHDRLSEPGKRLDLRGLGFGSTFRYDLVWGPKPRRVSLKPVGGQFAWELIWTVEFNVNMRPQATASLTFAGYDANGDPIKKVAAADDYVMAFNFDTSWSYTFEGIATRTIRGYIMTPQIRDAADPHYLAIINRVADMRRHVIKVVVPPNMRRVEPTGIHENAAKNRLEFVYTDTQFSAEAFPTGCTMASGNYGIEADGIGLNRGTASLDVSLTTRPGISRANALPIFLRIAFAKQAELLKVAKANPKEQATVLISHLGVNHQMWSRTTNFSARWTITRCIQNFLFSAGIWQPVAGSNFTEWSTDMSNIWTQFGVAPGLRSQIDEQVIIDITNGGNVPVIGKGGPGFDGAFNFAPSKFPCPDDIPDEMTWLDYDIRLRVYREEPSVIHRKAVARPVKDLEAKADGLLQQFEETMIVAGGQKKYNKDEQHVVETMGKPVTYIALQFKGLRLKKAPTVPVLKSVDGKIVKAYRFGDQGPWHAFSILDCPVYAHKRWAIYKVTDGDVTVVKAQKSPTKCGGSPPPKPNEQLQY
jgi:hypothetical protein